MIVPLCAPLISRDPCVHAVSSRAQESSFWGRDGLFSAFACRDALCSLEEAGGP
jgi:hypothetical protein